MEEMLGSIIGMQTKLDQQQLRKRGYNRSVNTIRKLVSHVEVFVPGAVLRHVKSVNGAEIRDTK